MRIPPCLANPRFIGTSREDGSADNRKGCENCYTEFNPCARLSIGERVRAMPYSIRVLRKTGKWEHEIRLTIHRGDTPKIGAEIKAHLHDGKLKAVVTNIMTYPSKMKGEPAKEVHAREI
jgi:hypothetical protein